MTPPFISFIHPHWINEHGNSTAGIGSIAAAISRTVTAVTMALKNLETLGIVYEGTGRRRNQIFFYQKCLGLIGTGTEPL